jgi:GNAT superfamily N-acetyltransferase
LAELRIIYDYKRNERYRQSFNRLTNLAFNFSLEDWYEKGFWDDKYIPYSYLAGDEIVANVSVNKMELILDGERRKAIQIGTVMTHPDCRGQGLSAALMNYVLEEWMGEYDLFYLFANRSAVDFYPRFGFEAIAESQFTLDLKGRKDQKNRPLRKLDPSDPGTVKRIYDLVRNRKPISEVFGVENERALAIFLCLYVYNRCLYYLEEEAILAICRKEGRTLHLYDLICADEFDSDAVINRLADQSVREVVFYFTPDLLDIELHCAPFKSEDTFYVRGELFKQTRPFKYPQTAQA